jgi:hypothetical protein
MAVILRMRGLSFNAQPEDVRAYFHPTEVQELYICRRNGESQSAFPAHYGNSRTGVLSLCFDASRSSRSLNKGGITTIIVRFTYLGC